MSLPKTFLKTFHDEVKSKQMRYSKLDGTDMIVSHFGIGGASFALGGAKIYDRLSSQKEANEIVETLLRSGVNYIDTAPWYGQRTGEECLGIALKNIPREVFYIATKVGFYEPEVEKQLDYTRAKVVASVEESLECLNLEYIDLVQIHDPECSVNLKQIIEHTLPALAELKKAGKVRHVGITGYTLPVMKKIVRLAERGSISTVLSYCRFNLANQDLLDYLPFFKERGLGVISASTACMGLLAEEENIPDWHPAPKIMRKFCSEAAVYCKERGFNLASLGTKWCFNQSPFAVILTSFTSFEMALENLQSSLTPMSDKEKRIVEELNKRFFDPMPVIHWDHALFLDYLNRLEAKGVQQNTDLENDSKM